MRIPSGNRWTLHGGTVPGLLLLLGGLAGCGSGGSEEGAIRRGDQAFAQGDLTEALAEYRLGLREGTRSVPLLLRTAHTYARSGRIAEARSHYAEAVTLDPTVADLAASDLLRVAKRAVDRQDGVAAATAVEAAVSLRPGVSVAGVALPLARHFVRTGQFGRALSYFETAVQEEGSNPTVVFEMALTHEALGDCQRALVFLEQVRDNLPIARRSEVDWHVGNCSYELAREAQLRGNPEGALTLFQTTIALGEPRNRIAAAWFEIGEILAQEGECTEALRAFERSAQEDQGAGVLGERARNRVDDIRFRRGGAGPC